MTVMAVKFMAIALIVLAGISGGLLPIRVSTARQSERWLMWGSAFSGGIFLSAGLLHLLVDARAHLEAFAPGVEYPFVLLLCGIGFLMVLFLERVLLSGHDMDEAAQSSNVQSMVLVLVLSIHSLIAGIALGLETELLASLVIFIAIIAHKGFAAFALGTSLQRAQMPVRRIITLVGLFSVMTPLGVLVGAFFAGGLDGQAAHGLEALFDALAAGTFLYVAIMEIIDEVFEKFIDLSPKFWLMSSGFACMALLAIWA